AFRQRRSALTGGPNDPAGVANTPDTPPNLKNFAEAEDDAWKTLAAALEILDRYSFIAYTNGSYAINNQIALRGEAIEHGLYLDLSSSKTLRNRAVATDEKLSGYIDEQRGRVLRLNQRFRDTYARTSDELARIFEDELEHQQDMDYVRFADAMLVDWERQTVR